MTTTDTRAPAEGASGAPAHPRIRARRIEVKRDEGRRRRNRLLALVVGVLVVGAVAGFTRSPVLDIDRLTVGGAGRTGVETVLERSGLRRGEAMVDVDGDAVTRRLERLPWVEKAVVERVWPSSVRIKVTERRPVAQVAAGGGRWAVVDGQGRVVDVRSTPDRGLVRLVGPVAGRPGSALPAATRPMLVMAVALSPRSDIEVESIELTDDELGFVLAGGSPVLFGPARELDAKLYALEAMLAREVAHCVATVDVRVPSAPVLTRKVGCA